MQVSVSSSEDHTSKSAAPEAAAPCILTCFEASLRQLGCICKEVACCTVDQNVEVAKLLHCGSHPSLACIWAADIPLQACCCDTRG